MCACVSAGSQVMRLLLDPTSQLTPQLKHVTTQYPSCY